MFLLQKYFLRYFLMGGFVTLIGILPFTAFAALSCSITTAALCTTPAVVVVRMGASTNTHAELPGQANAAYASNVVCCTGVTSLSNSCTGFTVATVMNLAAVTNSHAQENIFATYTNPVCISAPAGTLSVGYSSTACSGYDTTLAALSATNNAHIGSPASYPSNAICAKYLPSQALSYSLSATSVGFGNLASASARYATTGGGVSTPTVAHTITVSTNASSGYSVTVQGATLTSGANTITAIGGTNTASAPGTSQFGINLSASGGSGGVVAPYAGSGFAYAANASTPSRVASAPSGDGVNTVYSVEYLANILGSTSSSSYSSTLTYSVTANF